jgi:thioredoxin reductase (NADPH)
MDNPDVVIVGGGPAGMSALLWCRSLHLSGVLLEGSAEPGGQMLQMFHQIPDYPGLPGLTGREMRDHFIAQLNDLGLDWRADCRVEAIDPLTRTVICAGREWQGKGLVIATGARKRTLEVPGADRFILRGVSFSGTRDHSLYAGRKVCVIGGGDSAIENCLILARVCPEVTLIHRSDRFRARQVWLDEVRRTDNVKFLLNTDVVSIEGEETVTGITVRDRRDGTVRLLDTGAVFIKIGITPNTEPFASHLTLDAGGYIVVNQRQQTSLDWVYAVGDVTNPVCLSVATAVGQAAIAVKDIKERIEKNG